MFARGSLGCQALFFHSSDFVAYSHRRNDRNSAGAAQPPGKTGVMRSIANRLAQVPGVVAVTLGGSRASGTATDDSDWDFGLYYRGTIDPADIRALGWPGRAFAPGDWGRIVDGGAWLTIDGIKVDLIYRDIDVVTHWVAEAEDGRFEIQREVGYVAGIATYILAGELALGEALSGALPRPAFSEALRASAPPRWFQLAAGALHHAEVHARRGDSISAFANLGQAVLATAQGRIAATGEWALNEKRIIDRAGLASTAAALQLHHDSPEAATVAIGQLLALPRWG